MLAPCLVSVSVRRAAFNPIPSGEGSFARLMVLAILLLATVGGFAQSSVSLNENSFIEEKTYDKEALSRNFELTNLSPDDIAVELFLEEDAECEVSFFICGGAQNFTLSHSNFDNIATGEKAVFNVSLNNTNAGLYKANLVIKPSSDIQAINVPIAITIYKRQLTAEFASEPKIYNDNADIKLSVTPGNAVPGDEDKIRLVGSGVAYSWVWRQVGTYGEYIWEKNPNVAGVKCVRDIYVDWPDDFDDPIYINNYRPPLLENDTLSTPGYGYCFIEATITQAVWDTEIDATPVATPSSFTYGDVSLDTILNGSWRFKKGSAPEVYNPHLSINNPLDEDFVVLPYDVELPPPEDPPEYALNYKPKPGEVKLTIRKRSLNNELDTVYMNARCGESGGNLKIEAKDPTATVVYEGIHRLHSLEYPVKLEYGENSFDYSILSQAYEEDNPNYSNDLSYHFERSIMFRKVAYRIRGNTFTLNFDTSDSLDEAFFSKYDFDYAKTVWYKGKDSVYTGRNFPVTGSAGDDYSVILIGKDKETENEVRFSSCKENGAPPEVTPLTQPKAGSSVKLIASSFGSRMVPGGTNLMLNTPEGGKISIYTVAGELINRMNAVDARTIVKLPNSHKMYIVKLEAK